MLNFIGARLATLPWRIGVFATIAAAVVGLRQCDKANLRQEGATKAVAKIERANDAAIKSTTTARARSRDQRVRGIRDPYTAD